MKTRVSIRIGAFSAFLVFFFASAFCFAQSNNIEWYVTTLRNSSGTAPYSSSTNINGSWSNTYPTCSSWGTGNYMFSGDATPGVSSGSATSTVSSNLSWSGGGSAIGSCQTYQTIMVRVYGGKTVKFNINFTGSVSVDDTPSSIDTASANARYGMFGDGAGSNPAYSGDVQAYYSGNNGSDTGSGGAEITNSGSCGIAPTSYRTLNLGSNAAIPSFESGFNGIIEASSTMTYGATIPTDAPVINSFTPSISGVTVTGTVEAGSALRVTADANDPDDQVGVSPPKNICNYAWTITDPENVVTTSSGTNSYVNKTVTKAGKYTFDLIVTDNEGDTSTASYSITVGGKRTCTPGSYEVQQACDKKTTIKVDPFCGQVALVSHDPTATRGHALQNEIQINSQPIGLPYTQWMGNSSFTYGAQIVLVTPAGSGGGISNPDRILVDGYGRQFNYGITSSGSSPKTKGVFPTLTEHGGGYTLNDAGAPDEMFKSGNFVYEFDTNGKLLSLTDPNGNTQTLTYTSGDPTLVTDNSSGRTITFDYGSNGKINKVTENGGFAYREITYDLGDRVTGIITKNASNVTIRSVAVTYDGSNRIATLTRDGDSATTATLSYQDAGDGVSVANLSYPTKATSINYFATVANGAKFRTSVTNDKGGVVNYDFDADGNLIAVREPTYNGAGAAAVHTYTYDTNRNLLTESNGASTVTYTYNSLGLVTKRQDSLSRYIDYTYTGSNLTKIEDNLGTVAEFLYDDVALPNSVTGFKDGAANEWTIGRNSYGQVTSITPPTGSPTGALNFTYEETISDPYFGYLKTITNGAGDVATVNSYTALGDPTSITTNPASGVTRTVQMSYDAVQRETVFTHDDGKTVQTDYTGPSATSVTDEAGTLTQYSYCEDCGKLTGVSGPLSWALAWVLDDDKDVTSFTDALSKTTTYTYGTARELKQTTYPDATTLKYQYDSYGRFKKFTNGRNSTSTLTYDNAGNITNDGFFTYTYDNANRVLTAYDSNSTVTYVYGSNRLISSESYTFAGLTNVQKVEYVYNEDQTIDSITWKNGTSTVASWTYGYDGAGRVTSVVNGFSETTNFTYDGEGKLLTQTNENGTSRNYTYNNQRGWPTQLKYKSGSTTTGQYDLVYDGTANTVGNITGITELSGATVSYGYDDLYRLTSESRSASPSYSRTYGYDLNGNPTTINSSSFATFDNANKFSTVLSNAVTQDNDGNITAIATAPFQFLSATWDNRSKLTKHIRVSGQFVDYRYMYDGKRLYSKASTGSTSAKYYIFAGDTLIGEVTTATPSAAYTWGPDGLISQRNLSGSTSFWYEFGAQGETRVLTNLSGASTDTYNYNGYGELTASSGSTVNPYRYGGKYGYYTELYNGLILATQRWYSPHMMRWISRDSIGYEGGVNLYEYVRGNPIMYGDPQGTNPVAGAVAGAEIGSIAGPAGTAAGFVIGGAAVWWAGNKGIELFTHYQKPPDNAYDPNGPKAPGKPSKEVGFRDPKGGEDWVRNPNGKGWGWKDDKGNVWVPTGKGGAAHGGPHWDVQTPGGKYRNQKPKCK